MSSRIYKYKLGLGTNKIQMPDHAQALTAQMQCEDLHLWCVVDPSMALRDTYFLVTGTWCDLPDHIGRYISTVHDGEFVWHVFEEFANRSKRAKAEVML